jgi:acyl carrier protein
VKLRGFRIELGEIEARIKDLEAVSNCVVVLREDRPGDQRLVTYYVVREGQAVSVPEMRRHLQSKLPEYMIPQHFVKLESMPLTPNGKVDRKALPRPEADISMICDEPLTVMEEMLASIWKEVLSLDYISVHDNFFEIGGHSLLSLQVISRLEEKTGLRINPREFIYQTLGQLATSVEQQILSTSPDAESTKKKSFWQKVKKKVISINNKKNGLSKD